jgi:DNA-binding response OmpR family regulator
MQILRGMELEDTDDEAGRPEQLDTVPPPEKPTVLYIEHDAATVRFVDLLLGQRPELKLLSAARGDVGLELAQQHQPAVILLDVHLPDVDGTDLLAAIRRDPVICRTPVIVLSAEHDRHFAAQMLAAGAQAFLPKPLDLAEFFAALDAVMRRGAPSS